MKYWNRKFTTQSYTVKPVLRGTLGIKKNGLIRQVTSQKRFNAYAIFHDRTRKKWPFNTVDCLIEVTARAGLTVFESCKRRSIRAARLYIPLYRKWPPPSYLLLNDCFISWFNKYLYMITLLKHVILCIKEITWLPLGSPR